MNSRVTLLLLGTFVLTIGCSRNPSVEGSTAPVVKAGQEKPKDARNLNGAKPKERAGDTNNAEGATKNTKEPEGPKLEPAADAHAHETQPLGGGGSGTAFVVHPDGYLITNAHVVQLGKGRIGRLKIDKVAVDLILDKKMYKAKVLALDEQNDLALLKIDGKNFPALPLTERVELAEDVRAFGYPLPELIKSVSGGESINVTRGSVSAIQKGWVQTDTAINPGNSGGPLVNNKGEVVGVVTKGLNPNLPEKPTAIFFAVSTSFVKSLLEKHKVELPPAKNQRPLDGPALARRVVPSVAFVRVLVLQATLETGRVIGPDENDEPEDFITEISSSFSRRRPALSPGGRTMFVPYKRKEPDSQLRQLPLDPGQECIMVWDVRKGKLVEDVRIPNDLCLNSLSKGGTALSLLPRRFVNAAGRTLPTKTRRVVVLPMLGDLPKREFGYPPKCTYKISYLHVAFSKDAKLAAALFVEDEDVNGKPQLPLQVWDLSTGTAKTIATLEMEDGKWQIPPCSLTFAPDATRIAVRLADRERTTQDVVNRVKCLEVSTGRIVSSTNIRDMGGLELAFSQNGKHLLAGGHLIDPSNGKILRKLLPVPEYAWLADRGDLAVAPHFSPREGHLTLWDVSQGKEVLTIKDTVFSRDQAAQYHERMSRYPLDEFLVLQTKTRYDGAYRPMWVVAPDLSVVAAITDATPADSGDGREIKITFFNLEYRLNKLLGSK